MKIIKNCLWFVFVCKCDEFHPKVQTLQQRQVAHRLDMKFMDAGLEYKTIENWFRYFLSVMLATMGVIITYHNSLADGVLFFALALMVWFRAGRKT